MKTVKASFTAGELTSSLHARVDIEKYFTGLKTARNMIVHPHGGISNRGGLKFVDEVIYPTKKSRLIPFVFSDTQKYVIEFAEKYASIYKDGSKVSLTNTYPGSDDFDPSENYYLSNIIKQGETKIIDFGSGRKLFFTLPYGVSFSSLITIICFRATYLNYILSSYGSAPDVLQVWLANATSSKNSADLIQENLRAHSDLADIIVTENSAYASNRPISVSPDIYDTSLGTNNKIYEAINNIIGSPTNTGLLPSEDATNWEEVTLSEIATPYLESELADLKFVQSADILYITHPNHPPKELTRYADDNWELNNYDFQNGPFMDMNIDEDKTLTASAVSGSNITVTASGDTFDSDSPSGHIGALFEIRHDVEAQAIAYSFTSSGFGTSIRCGKTWRIITHGTWTGTVVIENSYDGGTTWKKVRSFSSVNDYNANTYGDFDEPCLIRMNCTVFTSGTINTNLSADPFTNLGVVKITAVASATSATASVIEEIGSTGPSIDWSEGSWSNYRGWPSCVVFFQDRLCFASTESELQGLWMTKTGNYVNFGRSIPLVDTDGISVRLPSRKINVIRNLIVLNGIIAFTSSSEWSINPGPSGALTPTSIVIKQEGERGSNHAEPVIIGNRGIFLQPTGKIMRDFAYEYSSNSFTGIDLTILSSHLFKNSSVIDFAFQQEPDSLVWCVLDDGSLLSLTYLLEQEVIAWTRHDTDGKFESICSLPSDDYDEIWVIVKRGDKRFIEVMGNRQASEDVKDQFFVDAGITYDSPVVITGVTKADPVVITAEAHGYSNGDFVDIADIEGMTELNGNRYKIANKTTNTFELKDPDSSEDIDGSEYAAYEEGGEVRKTVESVSGLSHLEGKEVSVLADGFVFVKTVSSGAITLTDKASRIHVGLAYVSDFETLDLELNLNSGTIQGRKIKVSEVIIRFLNSRAGYLGADFDDMDEINNERTIEDVNDPINMLTGDFKQLMGKSGFAEGGRICYRQSLPLPVTILGVIPEVEVGNI